MNKIPIETILDIYDPNIQWYSLFHIGYNGYEIAYVAKYGGYIIRSMKWKKYPYGVLINPKSGANTLNPTYELSDNNNNRVSVKFYDIYNAIYNSGNYYVPNNTTDRVFNSRQSCTVTQGRRNKTLKSLEHFNEDRFYPKFTIIGE